MNKLKTIIKYTLLFLICAFFSYTRIIYFGKTLIWNNDALSGHFEAIEFRYRWIRSFFNNIINNVNFEVPFINYNLTSDSNLTHNIGFSVFDPIFWIVPQRFYENAFIIVNIFRLYIAGLCALLLIQYFVSRRKIGINNIEVKGTENVRAVASNVNQSDDFSIFGAVIYVFSCYPIVATIRQPYFLELFIFLPLCILGVEKTFDSKKSVLIPVVVFLTAIDTIYFLYYVSALTAIYILFRLILKHDKPVIEKIKITMEIVGLYLIGIAMSAVVILPLAIELLESTRLGESTYFGSWLSYGSRSVYNTISRFFLWNVSFVNRSEWGYVGINACTAYPICYMLCKKNRSPLLISLFALTVIGINLPIIGKMFGISTVNNRWCFCLALICAVIFSSYMPEVLRVPLRERMILNCGVCALFLLPMLDKDNVQNQRQLIFTVIIFFSTVAAINVIWSFKLNGYTNWLLSALICFIVSINSTFMFTESFVNRYMVSRGAAINVLESYVDVTSRNIQDDGFYRIEKSQCVDEISCNLPYWFGYNGISSTGNFINPNSLYFWQISENTGLMKTTKVSDLDARITAATLADVKYFICNNEDRVVPYGFRYYMSDGEFKIYVNPNVLPIGYVFNKTVDIDDYLNMNVAERDEIMLKALVVDSEHSYSSICNYEDSLSEMLPKSRNIKYSVIGMEGVSKTEDGYKIDKDNARIDLEFKYPEEAGELFIEISDVHNGSKYAIKMAASVDGFSGDAFSASYRTEYQNRMHDFCINLGTGVSAGVKMLTINFSGSQGEIYIGAIKVYHRSLIDFGNDIANLKTSGLRNIQFGVNGFSGDITVRENGWLCFSVPYREGWTCKVDGQPSELIKGNLMYLATPINNGEHTVELSFFPPGIRAGLVISIIGGLGTLFCGYRAYFIERIKLRQTLNSDCWF